MCTATNPTIFTGVGCQVVEESSIAVRCRNNYRQTDKEAIGNFRFYSKILKLLPTKITYNDRFHEIHMIQTRL